MKVLQLLALIGLPFLVHAQVSFGFNTGVGIGFNAPETFKPATKYSTCSGQDQIKYSVFQTEGKLYFKHSRNQGLNWTDSTLVYILPSASSTMVNNRRIDTEPRVACDLSGGPYNKRIYMVWSDLKNGKSNLDVFLMFSDDEGRQWTEPLLLSYHPNHKHQFLPDILVDPKTGSVYVLYLDQQNFLNETGCDVQLASSTNGGLKFDLHILNEEAMKFSGSLLPKLVQRAEGISANWNPKIRGKYVDESSVSERGKSGIVLEKKSFTNTKDLNIAFELQNDSKISVELSKPLDAGFHKIVLKQKKYTKGKNSLNLASTFLHLPEDNYIITFYDGQGNTFAWIIPE